MSERKRRNVSSKLPKHIKGWAFKLIKILIANEAHDCWLKSIIGDFGVLLTKLYRKTGTICSVCSKCSFKILFHWTYLSLNSRLNIFSAYSALSCLKAQCKPMNLHANCVTNQTTSKKAFHLLAHQPPPVTPLSVSIPNTGNTDP